MPALTLSTDIGQSDFITGAIKGQLIASVPSANIIDITHQLSPANYQQAAYICRNAFKYFPPQTFHIVIVNFFERDPQKILFAEYNKQYIICPDNGILTMITGVKPDNIFSVNRNANNNATLLDYTLHIANAIEKIVKGENSPATMMPVENIEEKYPMRSTSGADWIESQIIFIDNFENVVVNLTKKEFEELRQNRKFKIVLMRNSEFIEKISDNYSSVQPGENLAWFNSAGYLEIAINKGNIAGLFGLQGYSESNTALQNRLPYQTIRILFY
jgi:S-adenosyl-L-methionine hydrolase (adenosine-forming)